MCEIAMAQVYSNTTSQIQFNCQNLLRIIKKIFYTNIIIKKNIMITKENINIKIKFLKNIKQNICPPF